MSFANVIRILVEGREGAQEVLDAYNDGKRQAREDRQRLFAPLGAPPGCLAPAAHVFHEDSKISPGFWPLMTADEAEAFTLNLDYRRYPGARRITLPSSAVPLSMGVEAAIRKRRSVRRFSDAKVELGELSKILEVACGVTSRDDQVPRRAYPSGGALYPIEVYPVALGVDGLANGVYHYATLEHELEAIRSLDGIADVRRAFPELVPEAKPPLILLLTVALPRAYGKYGERGYRFALLEAGHVAQNVVLTALALGLDTVCMGGFFDDDTNLLLQLSEGREAAVYGVLLGRAS